MKWMSLLAIAAMLCPAAGCGCCSCFRRSEPVPVAPAPYCPPPAACDPCATGPGVGVPPSSAYSTPGTSTFATPGTSNYMPSSTFAAPSGSTYNPQQSPINYNMPAPQL